MECYTLKDRIRGSLIGGAIGDQLGYPVEFCSYFKILNDYGENGITRFSGEKVVSDDTQMALFTACGLLNNVNDPKTSVTRAYTEWYRTQTGRGKNISNECWITSLPQLNVQRAPGLTCMSSIQSIINDETPLNYSKGCGGVMRIAPIALYGAAAGEYIEYMDSLSGRIAGITHCHPLASIPASFMSHLIYRNVLDENPSRFSFLDYIEEGLDQLDLMYINYIDEFSSLIRESVELALGDLPDFKCIHKIGEGWTGDEAVAIAVFCCLRHFNDFDSAIISAVNHDGDSDSTGSITGNIIGAAVGYNAIADYFKSELELHDVILHIADDLFAGKTTPYH